MSGEYQIRWHETGVTLYACLVNPAGQWWNGSAFETFVVANWTTYDITLTETPASSYFYVGDHPAALTDTYSVMVYKQVAGAPAITDYLVGSGEITWDGGEEITPYSDYLDENNVLNVYNEIPEPEPIFQVFK